MSQRIDLKELERKAWLSNFTDGLWDMYLGLLLLNWALLSLLSDSGVREDGRYVIGAGVALLALLGLWAGKHYITVPRMGRVRLRPETRVGAFSLHRIVIGGLLAGLVCFGGGLLLAAPGAANSIVDWSAFAFPLIFALVLLIMFSLAAYFLRFTRLVLIGVLYALTVPIDTALSEFAGIDADYLVFAVAAGLILLMGGVLLARFVQAYPLPEQE